MATSCLLYEIHSLRFLISVWCLLPSPSSTCDHNFDPVEYTEKPFDGVMAKKRKSKAASTSADGKTPKKSGKAKSLKSKCDENEDVDLVVSESAESAPVEWQPEDPDPTEDGDEDDEVAHGNFVKDLAALEGAPR